MFFFFERMSSLYFIEGLSCEGVPVQSPSLDKEDIFLMEHPEDLFWFFLK